MLRLGPPPRPEGPEGEADKLAKRLTYQTHIGM